ncbi:hypothetical protein ABE438_04960 [Bosea sp. TWI1241]|uniref:hypothetical protein n=1 Tax=Bosea sp. TWI1241 TaxID=3148904 RepID=UPI0032083716
MHHLNHVDTSGRAVPHSFAGIVARFLGRFVATHGKAEMVDIGDVKLIAVRDLADHWAVVETQTGTFLKCGGDGIVTTDDLIYGDVR